MSEGRWPVDWPELVAPFPYFGGKRRAAPIIWRELGDPAGYVEPFAGSAAVLLARPAFKGRRVETINDADGWLVNTWRAIQLDPARVARHAAGPVSEIDYHARLAWLQERRTDGVVSWLEGNPEAHDAKAAGWWLYVAACGIGDPWGSGPWRVVGERLVDSRSLPHLGDAGQGVNRELPHLGNAGRGVNRELPHLGNAGQGERRRVGCAPIRSVVRGRRAARRAAWTCGRRGLPVTSSGGGMRELCSWCRHPPHGAVCPAEVQREAATVRRSARTVPCPCARHAIVSYVS